MNSYENIPENAKLFIKKIEEANKKSNVSETEIQDLEKKKILPIVGCEFQVCPDRNDKTYKNNGYQVPFLAKNKNGYQMFHNRPMEIIRKRQ